MMLHIPSILSADQVRALRERLAGAEWVDGRESVGSQGAQVKRNRQLLQGAPLALELGQVISRALMSHPTFVSAVLPLRMLPPFFNSYEGGEHYGMHIDGAIRTDTGDARPLRTDVSTTVFLSDPDEYEGGELVFHDSYGVHEIKLPAGDAIVYPSTTVHQVQPVTQGARIASFLWTQSMVRDPGRRAMLYDLDVNIQTLRALHGDSAPIVGLTGHYHNLLRQWAEM